MIPEWVRFTWIGGPHDGEGGWVHPGDHMRPERVCYCHGALYVANRGDDGWLLEHVGRRVQEPTSEGAMA